jgi:DinB family protein
MTRPQSNEAASYYFAYIDLITSDEIVPSFKSQLDETLEFLKGISEEQSLQTYAPGKWTIRELLNHVNDGERLFLGRALWFARGFQDPLPGFEQDVAVEAAQANHTPWSELVEEFRIVRLSTISFFNNMPEEAWSRTGTASDNPFTVRALAYIIAGHVAHHIKVLREKYGISG